MIAGWTTWRGVSGVMCDKQIPVKLKSGIYKCMVRPALLYGLETLPMTSRPLRALEVAQTRMLRMSLGLSLWDKATNASILKAMGVEPLFQLLRKRRLRWYGHVLRRDDSYVGKRVLALKVKGTRKRGRPRGRWLEDCVKEDLQVMGMTSDEASDRDVWETALRGNYLRGTGGTGPQNT